MNIFKYILLKHINWMLIETDTNIKRVKLESTGVKYLITLVLFL